MDHLLSLFRPVPFHVSAVRSIVSPSQNLLWPTSLRHMDEIRPEVCPARYWYGVSFFFGCQRWCICQCLPLFGEDVLCDFKYSLFNLCWNHQLEQSRITRHQAVDQTDGFYDPWNWRTRPDSSEPSNLRMHKNHVETNMGTHDQTFDLPGFMRFKVIQVICQVNYFGVGSWSTISWHFMGWFKSLLMENLFTLTCTWWCSVCYIVCWKKSWSAIWGFAWIGPSVCSVSK